MPALNCHKAMKKIILLVMTVSGISAPADVNWGRAVCEKNHGQVVELQMQHSQILKIEVCFLGQAMMELDTLDRSRFNSFGGPEANRAYRESNMSDFSACERKLGRNRRGKDLKTSRVYNICEFSDRSWIGTDTLKDGVHSNWNRELNRVLGIF